eukprot:7168282-Pyramimonas_sp.AAC.1
MIQLEAPDSGLELDHKGSLVEFLSDRSSSSSMSPSVLACFCSGPDPPSKLSARGLTSPELDFAPSIKPNVKLGISILTQMKKKVLEI